MKYKCRLLFLFILASLIIWTFWGNTALTTTHYQVQSQRLPQSFDGLKIAQISDLHNAQFGASNKKLLTLLKETQPDVIAITGDFVDRRCDEKPSVVLIERLSELAPVYCVTGNHEELERRAGTGTYERLLAAVLVFGVYGPSYDARAFIYGGF